MWVTGVLGESVKITKDKTKLSVSTDVPMSKRCATSVASDLSTHTTAGLESCLDLNAFALLQVS